MSVDFKSLPKIELHCHLDASLRVSTVADLGRKIGLDLPNPLQPALIAPECCIDLADYLVRIDLALEVMQQRDHLVRIAREVVEDLAADGVIYGEIRFAPQLHLRNGLNMQEVLSAVHEGLKQGEQQTGMKTGLIVCCLRHESGECSLEIAKLAVNNRDKVCALDLAGDEARYIGAPHVEAFALARREGLRRTVHAGEAAGADSVREAIDVLGAERIGHGVRITESDELRDRAKATRLPLEMCPLSNVQTRAATSLSAHPIDRLFRKGLHVTVNTDCRTVSLTTITKEFERLESTFNWGAAEFHQCQRNSAEAAFVSDEVRTDLMRRLTAAKAAS
ncbi:MAG TPA: adenosine deaminase [Candidatus Acidoferrum sp.]